MIPYGRQSISEADITAVTDVLRSDYLTQGAMVPAFESAIAKYCGARHGVAANSATSALHIACSALGLGPGDTLWTSPITFVASANCGLYCGSQVDFVDIDPDTRNICPQALETKLELAARAGKLPKIVVAVHFAGQSCNMSAINILAQKFGFYIIEDASHAIGSRYLDSTVGSCKFSDITVFSFHPVKIITSAEGGMATTNDATLARSMASLRSHGITRNADQMTKESEGAWYYQQHELGWNYRMTELQAALGKSQLSRLDSFVSRRQEIACQYDKRLKGLPLKTPWRDPDTFSSFHLYVISLTDAAPERAEVFNRMRKAGVGVNVHYIPVHLQPYYHALGFRAGQFPASEIYYKSALSIPIYPDLSDAQQDTVIEALYRALEI